jgi:SAM-dependent methyltransferase
MRIDRWRSSIAEHVPADVRRRISAFNLERARSQNAAKPIEAVFEQVYRSGAWGEGESFDSGSGSRGQAATEYTSLVRRLIRAEGARSVVDVGCGDFRVAAQFADDLQSYVGVDVVPHLVARNNAEYGSPRVSFACLDASESELPAADICLVRQVLQHLSNAQIHGILDRCRKFPVVVITEHWASPESATAANLDKPHGPDTRLDKGSHVDVTLPPFNLPAVEEVLRVPVTPPLYQLGETLQTMVWRPRLDIPGRSQR